MRYTAQVLHGFNPLEELEGEWRELFNQAESPNPFFSAEWVFTWLNHRGGRVFPVTLIVRDDDNRLVASWPFFEYPAIGGRGLWVGLSDIADCLEPLVIRPDESLVVVAHDERHGEHPAASVVEPGEHPLGGEKRV
ncbi:MAG TPA: hypothetical protein QGH16_06895, partial [Verrucomicrobiota bacterium]|nr:hypothetical protein [Verrucomicrobiota bacterium]